jgi:UDP-N-acetyl-D-mannosaminuronic acid transferase (WecB/TagA/CpsF family)
MREPAAGAGDGLDVLSGRTDRAPEWFIRQPDEQVPQKSCAR